MICPPPEIAAAYDWAGLLRIGAAADLHHHLRFHPLPVALLLAAAPPPCDGEPYGRRPVYRDEIGELLLVRWREATFCAPHDHGDASGSINLLRGDFIERQWRWAGGEVVQTSERRLTAPRLVNVGARAIHDMMATGDAVGLHIYRPAIGGMRVFDRDRRQTLVVGDDCGAWVPRDGRHILSRTPW